jgi:DNA topoisomerase-1
VQTFGADPETGGVVMIKIGRFGPYATDGKTNASLGKKRDPEKITEQEAFDLLKRKRERGPSKWRRRG